MKKSIRRILTGAGIVSALCYFGVYGYYRFIDDGGVIDCVGDFSRGGRSFTFSKSANPFGDVFLCDSFAGPSVVSRLSEWSGVPLSETVNGLYWPLARLDHLFTRQWISFTDHITRPIAFGGGGEGDGEGAEVIDLNLAPETVEFEGFTNK